MGGENARRYDQLQTGSSDARRRIEVHVESDDDGRRQVILQDLSYGPGIGWYAQKTIRLDPEQLDALMGALSCARQESRRMGKSSGKNAGSLRADTADQVLQLADFLNLENS